LVTVALSGAVTRTVKETLPEVLALTVPMLKTTTPLETVPPFVAETNVVPEGSRLLVLA
jgi:hypothetical protein